MVCWCSIAAYLFTNRCTSSLLTSDAAAIKHGPAQLESCMCFAAPRGCVQTVGTARSSTAAATATAATASSLKLEAAAAATAVACSYSSSSYSRSIQLQQQQLQLHQQQQQLRRVTGT
jgi:hypothetical protein